MGMDFLKGLLNDGKLKKVEFDVAAKYVADRYDIEAVEYEIVKLRHPNLQTKEPVLSEEPIPELAVEKTGVLYISLTDIAKKFRDDAPSYVIQSWMRNRNTLEFLKLWEQKHNAEFNINGYEKLMDKFNSGAFTITPKQWIGYTGAVGISTKPGKNGVLVYIHYWLVNS